MNWLSYNASLQDAEYIGEKKGEEKTKIANATNMLQSGELSLEQVARFSGLPLEKIQELAESFKSEN